MVKSFSQHQGVGQRVSKVTADKDAAQDSAEIKGIIF